MYELLQLYLIIPKGLEAILYFLILIYMIRRANNTKHIQKHPSQLNILFLAGIAGWFIYIFLDVIIYVIAPLSITESYSNQVYSGYQLDIPSLFIANILRDFALLGALIMAWSYLIASFNIRYGQKKTSSIFFQKWYVLLIMVLLSIVAIIGDGIQVNKTAYEVHVNAIWTQFASLGLYLTILLFTLATIVLVSSFRYAIRENESLILVKKIRFLSWGIIVFTIGNYYWFITGYLEEVFQQYIRETVLRVILHYFGHLIWTISPILILIGFRLSESTDSKEDTSIGEIL